MIQPISAHVKGLYVKKDDVQTLIALIGHGPVETKEDAIQEIISPYLEAFIEATGWRSFFLEIPFFDAAYLEAVINTIEVSTLGMYLPESIGEVVKLYANDERGVILKSSIVAANDIGNIIRYYE